MPEVYRQKSGALIFVPTEVEHATMETMKSMKETKEEMASELAKIKEIRKELEDKLKD